MKTDSFWIAQPAAAAVILAVILLSLSPASAETRFAAPDGRSGNSGNSRSDAWNAQACFERLRPGDTCVYLQGDYGDQRFAPEVSGTANARIAHECESLHACRFDRIVLRNVAYLDIKNIASDTHHYDEAKSYVNPRMLLESAHHLKFDSIFVRGEPQACAEGNRGSGCTAPSDYNRYNDLIRIGSPTSSSDTSWMIEITGRTELIDGNHSVMQMFDDQDRQHCEQRESDIWIHGTPEIPIKMSSKFHHILSVKGACRVLVEHVDFGPAGTGRGDRSQPDNSTTDQGGGILHSSSVRNMIVRYSNFSGGGSATREARNNSHIEIGMFGDSANGACFAHNSHYRPWGAFAVIGRLNEVESVRNVSILNNAVAEPWYMLRTNASAATSPYRGFAVARTGQEDFVQVDIDGVAVSSQVSPVDLYFGLKGRKRRFSDAVSYTDGIQFGSGLWNTDERLFQQPAQWDFRPRPGSVLIGNAAAIATTTAAGTGNEVPVSRPECFAGTMNGLRSGDAIDIGGAHCTVKSVDLARGTIDCGQSIRWQNGAPIFYKLGNRLVRDVGSTMASQGARPGDSADNSPPKAPALAIE